MTMTPERATARLNGLQGAVNAAAEVWKAARERAVKPYEVVREVVTPLSDYYAQVLHRQRDADPAEARRLTDELLDTIRERGLLLEPADPTRPAAGIRLVDPTLARDEATAEQVMREAVRERDAFAREHADLIRQHADRLKIKRVRTALENESPGELAAALRGIESELPTPRPTALRSEDLAVTR